MKHWFLTRHALGRMAEMGLTRTDVVEVVDRPDTDYCDRKVPRRIAKRGDLSVVYDPNTLSIITILLNRVEQWDRARDKVRHA